MKTSVTAPLAALAASLLAGAPAQAQAPSCKHTVGMLVSLTGPAGRFGQAASKSVEMAFRDLNAASGAAGVAGCQLAVEVRDAQSQGTVAVDQARQ
ncbi:MAG: ABC transporter substrate-binding protein, partial [Betaproteobacteria bacterium]